MAEQIEGRARREAVQRVQIGLIGLGAVLLVVAFANFVVKTVRGDGTQSVAVTGQSVAGPANAVAPAQQADSEPFADLGVTPKSSQPIVEAPPVPVGPSVPDLEPDPRLNRPMDQDPQKPQQAPQRN